MREPARRPDERVKRAAACWSYGARAASEQRGPPRHALHARLGVQSRSGSCLMSDDARHSTAPARESVWLLEKEWIQFRVGR